LGRKRNVPLGPRIIDLDILAYGNRIIAQPELQVPHRFLPERRFALIPLLEIMQHWKHPALGITAATMLERCTDRGIVQRL